MECNCAYCTQPPHSFDRDGEPSPMTCPGQGACPHNNTCRYCDFWRYHSDLLQEIKAL